MDDNSRSILIINLNSKKKMKNEPLVIILAILALFLVWNLQTETFILYGGQEIEGYITDQEAQCWILGASDSCVKQNVFLINFTKQNLLACPDGYSASRLECEKHYGLIVEPKPTITCYYVDKECQVEVLELEQCPSQYHSSMDECKEALETPFYHITKLFKNPATLILLVVVFAIILFLAFKRR